MNGEAIHGQIVISEYQTKGRGQRGNVWESAPHKNLLFSIILDAAFLDPSECFLLNIVTSLALIDTLDEYTGGTLKIKWPNDIYFESKKISGMLIENYIKNNSIKYSVIGIGLNVNQTEFSYQNAVSLQNICNQNVDRMDLLEHFLVSFERRFINLKKGYIQALVNNYLNKMYWRNEVHVFKNSEGFFNGRIIGINKTGKLVVELEEEIKNFDFKEIEFIK